MSTQTSDFGQECRDALLNHWTELQKIDPAEPGRRNANATRRAEILTYIDAVLETYHDWREIEPFDQDFR